MTPTKPTIQGLLETAVSHMQAEKWAAALTALRDFAARNSDLNSVFFRLSNELREMGRLKEAEEVLHQITILFPDDQRAAFGYARMAYARRDWRESIKRFQHLTECFPDFLDGYRFLGDLLYGQKRYDEADIVIAEGMSRFPAEPRLAVSYAWSGHLKGDQTRDWRTACERWQSLVRTFPDERLGYAMLGFVLSKFLNRTEEAEVVLQEGMKRFPEDVAIAREHARAADYRNDWAEALRRWDALIERWPEDRSLTKGRGETEARQRLTEIDHAHDDRSTHLVHVLPRPSPEPTREGNLLLRFESLGENCEFGLVQRHFGVEPLGLLRWVALAPEDLCLALEEQFQGLDDPADMEVRLVGPEYHMYGKRYRMRMHTYIVESEYKGTVAQLHAQLFRRIRYLKEKFLEDLRAAEKLLLWQSGVGSVIGDETVLRMRDAVRSYGRNTLVVIRRDNEPALSPSAESRVPGLIEGRLHQTDKVTTPDGRTSSVSPFDGWVTLCRTIVKLWFKTRRNGVSATTETLFFETLPPIHTR